MREERGRRPRRARERVFEKSKHVPERTPPSSHARDPAGTFPRRRDSCCPRQLVLCASEYRRARARRISPRARRDARWRFGFGVRARVESALAPSVVRSRADGQPRARPSSFPIAIVGDRARCSITRRFGGGHHQIRDDDVEVRPVRPRSVGGPGAPSPWIARVRRGDDPFVPSSGESRPAPRPRASRLGASPGKRRDRARAKRCPKPADPSSPRPRSRARSPPRSPTPPPFPPRALDPLIRPGTHRVGRMVSLGRVAAPKPINLPSQRRENNDQDPNVTLVPRGSHTWNTAPPPDPRHADPASGSALVHHPGAGAPTDAGAAWGHRRDDRSAAGWAPPPSHPPPARRPTTTTTTTLTLTITTQAPASAPAPPGPPGIRSAARERDRAALLVPGPPRARSPGGVGAPPPGPGPADGDRDRARGGGHGGGGGGYGGYVDHGEGYGAYAGGGHVGGHPRRTTSRPTRRTTSTGTPGRRRAPRRRRWAADPAPTTLPRSAGSAGGSRARGFLSRGALLVRRRQGPARAGTGAGVRGAEYAVDSYGRGYARGLSSRATARRRLRGAGGPSASSGPPPAWACIIRTAAAAAVRRGPAAAAGRAPAAVAARACAC